MPRIRIETTKQPKQTEEQTPKYIGQLAVKEGSSIPGTSTRAKRVQEKILRTIS